jgi:hypothetical protein
MQYPGIEELAPLKTKRRESHGEEALVAELEQLGVRYLSRRSPSQPWLFHLPDEILAALVRQPNSRIRNAIIAVFLVHPEYGQSVPAALHKCRGECRWMLKIYYTAAFFLQQKYREELYKYLQPTWLDLPDCYSAEFIPALYDSPEQNLKLLGVEHQLRSGKIANWTGTYDHVARHLLDQLELEAQWNQ